MSAAQRLLGVIEVVDAMVAEGIIEKYAIGGALAATLYGEPIATIDLDIFFVFKKKQNTLVLSLDEIYDYARKRGFEFDHEFVRIDSWLVQFVESSHSPLWTNAIDTARMLPLDSHTLPVIDPEYLVAMWLFAGRAKDYQKIAIFLESALVERNRLKTVLEDNGLMVKWREQEWRFGDSI